MHDKTGSARIERGAACVRARKSHVRSRASRETKVHFSQRGQNRFRPCLVAHRALSFFTTGDFTSCGRAHPQYFYFVRPAPAVYFYFVRAALAVLLSRRRLRPPLYVFFVRPLRLDPQRTFTSMLVRAAPAVFYFLTYHTALLAEYGRIFSSVQ